MKLSKLYSDSLSQSWGSPATDPCTHTFSSACTDGGWRLQEVRHILGVSAPEDGGLEFPLETSSPWWQVKGKAILGSPHPNR